MMKRILFLTVLFFSAEICFTQSQTRSDERLRERLNDLINRFDAKVGIAVQHIETGDTLTISNHVKFPMQSVYKFPLAMAVLKEVDKGKLWLEQKIHITKKELNQDTWSPLAEKYPEGNIDITVKELLDYTVSKSDNNTCDILFKLLGGTREVDNYMHELGYRNISVKATEAEMKSGAEAVNSNWCYPSGMSGLLSDFYKGKHLSASSREVLMKMMIESTNSDKRLKGKLSKKTITAHKTGTGNNIVNDVGIITLPNGDHIAVSVFIKQSNEKFSESEVLISKISKLVFDFYND